MATLTQPENTGTLDRDAIQAAARRAATEGRRASRVDTEALDRHAADLRAWLEAHGTIDDSELARRRATADEVHADTAASPYDFPTGRPAILVHQHVWLPTPARWEPDAHQPDLDTLLDRAFAPVHTAAETFGAPDAFAFTALPTRPQDEVTRDRNHTLGWGLVVGLWAAAAALLVPLMISSVIGSFDLTVDLGGGDGVATEEPGQTADDIPADLAGG